MSASRSSKRKRTPARETAKKTLKGRSRESRPTPARKNSKQAAKPDGLSTTHGCLEPVSLSELQKYADELRDWLSDNTNSRLYAGGRRLRKGKTIVHEAFLRINHLLHLTHCARGFLPIYIRKSIADLIKALTPKGREKYADQLETWVLKRQSTPAEMEPPRIEIDVLSESSSRLRKVCNALSLFAVPTKHGRLDPVPNEELRTYAGKLRDWLTGHSRPSPEGRFLRVDETFVHAASLRINHLLHATHFVDGSVPADIRDGIDMLITEVVGKTVYAASILLWVFESPAKRPGSEWPTKNDVDVLTTIPDRFDEVCRILERIAGPRQPAEESPQEPRRRPQAEETRILERDETLVDSTEAAHRPPDQTPAVEPIDKATPNTVKLGRDTPSGNQHSPDFRSVRWNDQKYSFTATQAVIVKLLWKAYQQGTPEVSDAALLEAADSKTSRIVDIFRNRSAWGEMIVHGSTKGTRRLSDAIL